MQPGLLIILDGFAFGEPQHVCNAFELAKTPTFDRLRSQYPCTELANNGTSVGLPEGQMGNSEVGHMNIGAGRIVLQDFMRINQAVEDGSFGDNEALQAAFHHVKETGGRLHLMGLLGPGGVHAHESHFGAALRAAAHNGIDHVWVHPIGDGRDTPPRSAQGYLETLQAQAEGTGRIADLVGRYYAMDRDTRWERTQEAYALYAGAEGRMAPDVQAALAAAYEAGEGDEFIRPTCIDTKGAVCDGDAVVWLNFRPDRSRQMTRAFMQPDFDGFARDPPKDLLWVCMTQYDDAFVDYPGVRIAWRPNRVVGSLAEQASRLGLSQFHTAETEKYAHVTYFVNGGNEEPFDGEERHLVPSPKVATYDLKPEMSAYEVTDKLLWAIGSGGYDLIVANYANPDMVGHTGDLEATVRAVEVVDECINRVTQTAAACGFVTMITSDHGNCEEMCKVQENGAPGEPITKHSMHPSPLMVVGAGEGVRLRALGALSSVAPTLADLMGIEPAPEWTAPSLVQRVRAEADAKTT